MKLRKEYTSFLELEKDIEILKIKRKIHYQQIVLDSKNIKSMISIEYLLVESGRKIAEKYTRKSGTWLETLAPIILSIISARRS